MGFAPMLPACGRRTRLLYELQLLPPEAYFLGFIVLYFRLFRALELHKSGSNCRPLFTSLRA